MVWVDGLFIAVIILSALVSLWRGFVREALSLATWVLAFWIAWAFSERASPWFARWIETPSLQTVAGFALLFFVVLLIGALINHFAALAIEKTGLSGTDRMVGMIFGLLRGVVLVAILVMVGLIMNLARDPWWHDSFLIPFFEPLASWLMSLFPGDLG